MKLTETYSGRNERFEGPLKLWLRSLPQGARASRATLTLMPADASFEETLTFTGSQGELGARKTLGADFIEVDFRARRTPLRADGSGGTFTLQVDMGGALVGVAADGTFLSGGGTPWTLSLPAGARNLPGLGITRLRLTRTSVGGTFDLSSLTLRCVPSNLQARLGEMAPFWVRLGELARAETSPDFAEVLNFFLTSAEVRDGYYQIPLLVHSDSLARLDLRLDIDYVIEQPVLPPHLAEVNLPYDFSTLPGVAEGLLQVRLPAGAQPVQGRSSAAILGTFEPSRLALSDPGDIPAIGTLSVSPHCTLAQSLSVAQEIALTAIDLPLGKTQPGLAGLHLSLMSDADGKPSGEILASAEVKIGKPLPDGRVWGSAPLPQGFRLLPGVRSWLVLQSREGEAFWNLVAGDADQPTLQCSRDGGLSWRAAAASGLRPPLAAQLRLRHVPERFSLPVQLQIGAGATAVRRRLDEYAPAGKIEFHFDFAEKLAEHLNQPGVAPPPDDQPPLCNTDFALPAPRDATRRLFGFDAFSYWMINGAVDLSRGINLSQERYLTLSIGGAAPRRIDCAGADPRRTAAEEIVQAINRAVGLPIAQLNEGPTGQERFLSLQSPSGDNLELHPWCELGLPQCWQGTAERIHRLRRPRGKMFTHSLSHSEPGRGSFALLLVDGALARQGLVGNDETLRPFCHAETEVPLSAAREAILWQRFSVDPGSTYELRLTYSLWRASCEGGFCACRPEDLEAPQWQLEWFDNRGQALRLDSARLVTDTAPSRELAQARLRPPAQAAEAEWRLIHPGSSAYGLLVEELHLGATRQALTNQNFSQWEEQNGQNVPAGWTSESGWSDPRPGGGLRLRGDGPEDSLLMQQAEVRENEVYRLRVRAVPSDAPLEEDATVPAASRARVELAWQGENLSAQALIQPLDGRALGAFAWQGMAPAGAETAVLRLVQPRGAGDLLVEEVSFARVAMTEVPLTFLGEAPGLLKVSDVRVAYDLPESQTAAAPGEAAQAALMYKVSALMGSSLPALQVRAALAHQSVEIISGIGKTYGALLARQGIRTLGQLAILDTARVEGLSARRLAELRAAAELALEHAAPLAAFAELSEMPVMKILAQPRAELARLTQRSLDEIGTLHKSLRAELLLLDNKTLEAMTLGDLLGTAPVSPAGPEFARKKSPLSPGGT